MIHILVVDDEPISADGISIYLSEHGEENWDIQVAYNGIQALELARHRVDVLVMDIVMPGLDGFQVQERIGELWPMSRCVFLTSVSSVDYVQRAIRSEAIIDYVLKTESEEKILAAVRRAVAEQENIVSVQNSLKKAEQEMEKIRPMLQKELILSLLKGEHFSMPLEKRFQELGLKMQAQRPVLLLLGQLGEEAGIEGPSDIMFFVLNNLIETYLCPAYNVFSVSMSDHRIAVLVQEMVFRKGQNVGYIFSLMEAVQQTFRKAGGTVSFAVDDEYCSWNALTTHYHSLTAVLERNLFMDDILVLRNTSDELPEYNPAEELHKARVLLENGSYKNAASVLSKIRVPLTARGKIDLYRKFLKLLLATVDTQECPEKVYERIHIPMLQIDEKGWKSAQMEFAAIFGRLAAAENTKSKRMEQTVEHICTHIRENLKEDLSLIRMAELTGYSPTYLSRIFKDVKGVGYNDFVVECRMERASYLLLQSELKLSDIIEQVGYTSSSYFIRAFRRTFGMTPIDYRNRMKEKR